ncbi:MAG: hypothetical protein EOP86_27465, partial [Verrucomicrobiaceae bacterium]
AGFIGDFLNETPHAKARYEAWLAGYNKIEAFVVIADETRRPDALATVQTLRSAGIATDYNYLPAKVDKQFQTAEALGAKIAVTIGAEFPEVRLKDLTRRTEQAIPLNALPEAAAAVLAQA